MQSSLYSLEQHQGQKRAVEQLFCPRTTAFDHALFNLCFFCAWPTVHCFWCNTPSDLYIIAFFCPKLSKRHSQNVDIIFNCTFFTQPPILSSFSYLKSSGGLSSLIASPPSSDRLDYLVCRILLTFLLKFQG